MDFYNIKDDYINFLRQYDTKVAENKFESRPYVGIVLSINNINYYAPFTSPKSKHRTMKNGKDFRKINGGIYGAINFNNMIPVPDEALIRKDISAETDPKYKRLLQNQFTWIQNDWAAIVKVAADLHALILTDDANLKEYEKLIKGRCCNLSLLESIFSNYNK